jgi:hypothetical protein
VPQGVLGYAREAAEEGSRVLVYLNFSGVGAQVASPPAGVGDVLVASGPGVTVEVGRVSLPANSAVVLTAAV